MGTWGLDVSVRQLGIAGRPSAIPDLAVGSGRNKWNGAGGHRFTYCTHPSPNLIQRIPELPDFFIMLYITKLETRFNLVNSVSRQAHL